MELLIVSKKQIRTERVRNQSLDFPQCRLIKGMLKNLRLKLSMKNQALFNLDRNQQGEQALNKRYSSEETQATKRFLIHLLKMLRGLGILRYVEKTAAQTPFKAEMIP